MCNIVVLFRYCAMAQLAEYRSNHKVSVVQVRAIEQYYQYKSSNNHTRLDKALLFGTDGISQSV